VRAGPVLWGEELVVGTEAGALYRIAAQTGEQGTLFTASGAVLSLPAVADGIIYVGTTLGNVYALDLSAKGSPEVWVYPPKKQ